MLKRSKLRKQLRLHCRYSLDDSGDLIQVARRQTVLIQYLLLQTTQERAC